MSKKIKLNMSDGRRGIGLEYVNMVFNPTENTGITLYDDYKISIMLSSGMIAVTDSAAFRADFGDFYVFRPDEIHFARITDKNLHKFLHIFIPPDYFDLFSLNAQSIFELLEHNGKGNLISPSNEKKERLITAANSLISLMEKSEEPPSFELYTKTLNLLLLLTELYHNADSEAEKPMPLCVSKTLEYISQNYGRKITLKELAGLSFCSVAYLSKTFKAHVGCTVYEQITNYRIINAKKLLKEGKSVTEVCFECGFSDCSHFIKTFKRLTGTTPHKFIN